ncbi:SHOCT domain-containing protein [Streptomyces sp. H39-S7]|uniref:SHOCT domain-containing protein n=1 Tax=Streptomyces sp. H39-S7 TaxID=3004357 RepID=UPI0022B05A1D|nr:SHOCT domain-containing protein [Streptomyces sp. H39-S7]MCZ4125157.1 SHOCT domain-containing protein [Streptomyces sp. H39-S7]
MSAPMNLAYDYPLLGIFWSMFLFFLWIMWFMLLFRVIRDIFRDHEMSGWAKAGWLVLTILLPFLGVLVYVIARGGTMGRREVAQAREQQAAFNSYVREAATEGRPSNSADELAKLSKLRAAGDITDEEFSRAKGLILNDRSSAGQAGSTTTTAPHAGR